MEKPDFLYHGSPHKLEALEPKTKPHREKEEGELVYAIPDKVAASMFMAENLSITGSFIINGEQVHYAIIEDDREEYLKRDKGGHVYVLPSDKFVPSTHKGMRDEWVSKEKVKPIERLEYKSAIDAMIENGVQVYFINENTLKKEMRHAKGNQRFSILKNLQSENQRRGINFKPLSLVKD